MFYPKSVFHETPKSSMEQGFKAGYTIKLDTTFMFHETKFHRVACALATATRQKQHKIIFQKNTTYEWSNQLEEFMNHWHIYSTNKREGTDIASMGSLDMCSNY